MSARFHPVGEMTKPRISARVGEERERHFSPLPVSPVLGFPRVPVARMDPRWEEERRRPTRAPESLGRTLVRTGIDLTWLT